MKKAFRINTDYVSPQLFKTALYEFNRNADLHLDVLFENKHAQEVKWQYILLLKQTNSDYTPKGLTCKSWLIVLRKRLIMMFPIKVTSTQTEQTTTLHTVIKIDPF